MMNMTHLEYLSSVADTDVRELQRKEQTYRGSWKRRGGVGAFMMLARKWDRLEEMMKERQYDIFAKPGGGEDGTVIAEVRDLRRYLLLVEAELQSQGMCRDAVRVRSVYGALSGEESHRDLFSDAPPPKPNPGNGSQHESLYPWVVGWLNTSHSNWYHKDWYHKVGNDEYALEAFVEGWGAAPPAHLRDLYRVTNGGWVVRIELCPPGARDHYPKLQMEMNSFERDRLPSWQRELYQWMDGQDKFVLQKEWVGE
jgi:hypothetical protein